VKILFVELIYFWFILKCWHESSVRLFWPEWLKNPNKIKYRNAAAEARRQKQISKSSLLTSLSADDLDKEDEQRPVKSMKKWEYDEAHPETEESPFQALVQINPVPLSLGLLM